MKHRRVEDALVGIGAARQRLAVARAHGPITRQNPVEFAAVADGVDELLDAAEQAALGLTPPAGTWVGRFWTGRQLEATYPTLHAARVQMIDLSTEREITAAIPATLTAVRQYLDRDDPRRLRAEELPALEEGPARRALLRASREAAYGASDSDHRQQRTFRNAIIVATVVVSLLVLALTAVLFLRPQFASVCFDSVRQEGVIPLATTGWVDGGEEPVETGRRSNCPTGEGPGRRPIGWDVVLITLFGVVGAALSAVVTVRGLKVASSPYDVPLALSILKLPLGALTAFVGLQAIRAGLVPGLSALDSPAQIITYSVVLGYAQQLATGFLDRRAASLGKSDPGPQNPASPTLGPVVETRELVETRAPRRTSRTRSRVAGSGRR